MIQIKFLLDSAGPEHWDFGREYKFSAASILDKINYNGLHSNNN